MRARKVDNNHAEIIKALRKAGVFVYDTSGLGKGFPDIVCYRAGRWFPLEIKSSPKSPLTPAERRFWLEAGIEPVIVTTPLEAFKVVGLKIPA